LFIFISVTSIYGCALVFVIRQPQLILFSLSLFIVYRPLLGPGIIFIFVFGCILTVAIATSGLQSVRFRFAFIKCAVWFCYLAPIARFHFYLD